METFSLTISSPFPSMVNKPSHLAGQLGRRRSRPPPPLSPCLGASQHLTATHCPLPEPRQVVDHRACTAPSATTTCRARPRASHPARAHTPPLDRSPCPPNASQPPLAVEDAS